MIKFLDLNTGYSFDGVWENNQSKGYVFWFPDEQSTNIIYSNQICILSDSNEALTLSLNYNAVFGFPKPDITPEVISEKDDNFIEKHCVFTYTIDKETWGEKINDKYYAHAFNVLGHSKEEGEYILNIHINDTQYIKVGADFYDEYEPVYINLSNMGVEIPETIQKAIYDANVYEDYKDNILINRKFKELISNYWDIIANRGSYKSLQNSLKWFEWGDNLIIKEILCHENGNRLYFNDKDIATIFEDNDIKNFENHIKTTYISLYCSLFDELQTVDAVFNNYDDYNNNHNSIAINDVVKLINSTDNYPAGFYRVIDNKRLQYLSGTQYDSEYNPKLVTTIQRWTCEELQLKMALLAQFFGTFFLPIHMSILHAVVENSVFTNTVKAITGSILKRTDMFGDFEYVDCNIVNDSHFKMGNVNVQVSDNTVYSNGITYIDNKEIETGFGVDKFGIIGLVDDSSIENFAKYYYSGPGLIIPIELIINNQLDKDFIKNTIVDIDFNTNSTRVFLYDKINCKNNKFTIKFNYLIKSAGSYALRFTFITGSSKTITKTIKFIVDDADNLNINIYKVNCKDDSQGFTYEDFMDTSVSDYLFRIQPNKCASYYIQHLPYMLPNNELYSGYSGIKLSRTVVIDVQGLNGKDKPYSDYKQIVIRGLMDNDFLEFDRYDENNNIKYMVFVSKKFYGEIPHDIKNMNLNIIRNDLGFYPQFHKLVLMNGNTIDDYTISQYDAVCCAAEINNFDKIEKFRYGHLIDAAEWTFINATDNSIVYHPASTKTPFVATKNNSITPGYYDISFKYSLTNGITDECKLDSGFRIKVI